jgi:uncharacterized membrane protein SpoIIM required for sporulation
MTLPRGTTGSGRSRAFRLDVSRINVWSAVKVSFVLGVLFGVVTFLVLIAAWGMMSASGTLSQMSHLISSDLASTGGSVAHSLFSFKTALSVSAILGLLGIIGVTILGAIAAGLYNLFVYITGGAVVGFEPGK